VIEAELKARVRAPERLREQLSDLAAGEDSIYRDTYYDWPGHQLTGAGRELRVRRIVAANGERSVLTYKGPAVDAASGSKPEHESVVSDPTAVEAMLRGLGLVPFVSLEKQCTNYRFTARGRDMLATVVRVPELDGTFVELETMTGHDGMAGALAAVRAVLEQLGIAEGDLTGEQYTEAVIRARE
jgi:adenylate cyclase, class 2